MYATGAFVAVAVVVIAWGFLPPRLSVGPLESKQIAYAGRARTAYRLPVRNVRSGTTAHGVKVFVRAQLGGSERTVRAFWKHELQSPHTDAGEIEIPGKEERQADILYVYNPPREDDVAELMVRDAPDNEDASLPLVKSTLSIEIRARNARAMRGIEKRIERRSDLWVLE